MADINLTSDQTKELQRRKQLILNWIENTKEQIVDLNPHDAVEIRNLQKDYQRLQGRLQEINYLLDEC